MSIGGEPLIAVGPSAQKFIKIDEVKINKTKTTRSELSDLIDRAASKIFSNYPSNDKKIKDINWLIIDINTSLEKINNPDKYSLTEDRIKKTLILLKTELNSNKAIIEGGVNATKDRIAKIDKNIAELEKFIQIKAIKSRMEALKDSDNRHAEYAGLKVGIGSSNAFYIQEPTSYKAMNHNESIGLRDGKIHINGKPAEDIEDPAAFEQAHAMLLRMEVGKLFAEAAPLVPDHKKQVATIKQDDKTFYIAKTKKDDQEILFIQDEKAWNGGSGVSYSINLKTQTIWKDGKLQMMKKEDLALIRKLIGFKSIKTWKIVDTAGSDGSIRGSRRGRGATTEEGGESSRVTRGRGPLRSNLFTRASRRKDVEETQNQAEEKLNKRFKTAPPLNIPGLRYTDQAELASRSVYMNEIEGTKLTYTPKATVGGEQTGGTVTIDTSSKTFFSKKKFISQLEPWLGEAKQKRGTITFTKKFEEPPSTFTIKVIGNKLIMPEEAYVRVINGGGDRWMAKFCSPF